MIGVRVLCGALLCAACGKSSSEKSKRVAEDAAAGVQSAVVVTADAAPTLEDFDTGGDEGRALAELEALPAWSAVLERYRLLDRRGQEGVVYGLLAEVDDELRLVDETRGQGALSIPVALPLEVSPPLRLVLWGAWQVTEDRHWRWQARRMRRLAESGQTPAYQPGLLAREAEPPENLVPASAASRRGGAISFSVLERGSRAGDGWLIADEVRGRPVARLLLPGEEPTYGGQSSVTEAERWVLPRNLRFWIEIGRFRPAQEGRLPTYDARSPPFHYRRQEPLPSSDSPSPAKKSVQ